MSTNSKFGVRNLMGSSQYAYFSIGHVKVNKVVLILILEAMDHVPHVGVFVDEAHLPIMKMKRTQINEYSNTIDDTKLIKLYGWIHSDFDY
jgi:hypothetical protein